MNYEQIAIDELARCMTIARERFGAGPFVTHAWDLRGLRAGMCVHSTRDSSHLRFNAQLGRDLGEEYRSTIGHEYAHAVAWKLRSDRGVTERTGRWSAHGQVWQTVMHAFGYAAERCHNYPMQRAIERRHYVYTCACDRDNEHRVSIVRHRRALNGVKYRCRVCNTRLQPPEK